MPDSLHITSLKNLTEIPEQWMNKELAVGDSDLLFNHVLTDNHIQSLFPTHLLLYTSQFLYIQWEREKRKIFENLMFHMSKKADYEEDKPYKKWNWIPKIKQT